MFYNNKYFEIESWSVKDGIVDKSVKYFLLSYGTMDDSFEEWIDVAYLNYPNDGDFIVEFIIKDPKDEHEQMMLDEANWLLNYHIVERQLENPASYLEAYCSMSANFYSVIHLSVYEPRKHIRFFKSIRKKLSNLYVLNFFKRY